MVDMSVKEWHEQQFLPWKRAVAKYLDEKRVQEALLQQNLGQLQTIVALLLEGRTKPALMAWNSLQLNPRLENIKLEQQGEVLVLIQQGGGVLRLQLDDVVEDLQRMLDERGV
ncbi:MAG: hypothetical protein EBQ80_06645 [Proteobacteria bacterium]|nr:hypothetical protein [Pseudomonadota bacterium]